MARRRSKPGKNTETNIDEENYGKLPEIKTPADVLSVEERVRRGILDGDPYEMNPISQQCTLCAHLFMDFERRFKCRAFPNKGIPLEIWMNETLHVEPVPSQTGNFTYEPHPQMTDGVLEKNNPKLAKAYKGKTSER